MKKIVNWVSRLGSMGMTVQHKVYVCALGVLPFLASKAFADSSSSPWQISGVNAGNISATAEKSVGTGLEYGLVGGGAFLFLVAIAYLVHEIFAMKNHSGGDKSDTGLSLFSVLFVITLVTVGIILVVIGFKGGSWMKTNAGQ